MFEILDASNQEAVIKVIGVGGCGGNAVDHMVLSGVHGVEFICANTDAQALKRCQSKNQLHLGSTLTKGLGAGANPDIGRQAALEDRERIADAIRGADMLFLTAGMGGGTGTGAAPVVAEIAKEMGILTIAVVTKPFTFERKRVRVAMDGIEALSQYVDSLIVIPNDKLMEVLGADVTMQDAFKAGELERDVVCVVRWQGPQANGMPELHKLTPPLAILQNKGYEVALVTDGRMSGASGNVPAAIHVSPEAAMGGPLARVRDGDVVRVDALAGTLQALVPQAEWDARTPAQLPAALQAANGIGMGRELFAGMRRNTLSAEEGACSWL
jgi:hypothetical protein